MRTRLRIAAVAAAAFGLASPPAAADEEPKLEPAVVVRAIHPERQAAAVIALFAGSRAANPAVALAAWRRATGEHEAIGKPLQAVAAMFNPEMVPEWRTLHGAEFDLGVDAEGDGLAWGLVAPGDDGALAAAITALRLSGGADQPAVLDPPIAVERLGEPGSAIAARVPGGTVFAARRDVLAAEIERIRRGTLAPAEPPDFMPGASGFRITLHPDRFALDDRTDPRLARFATAARGVGLVATDGMLGLKGDQLELEVVSRFQPEGEGGGVGEPRPVVDPSWLSWFPARRSAVAVAVVLGPGAEFWNGLFQVADAIDRADPARAELAPLRTRLNFLGLARGVRLEADLWPLLRGASLGAIATDDGPPGETNWGVVVALHAADADAARRILDRVVTPFASLAGGTKPKPAADAATILALGRAGGRPLEAVARGSTVLVGWGEGALAGAIQSAEKPDESIAALVKEPDGRASNRFGVVWPGRVAGALKLWEPASPFAAALAAGSPVIWRGGWSDGLAWDSARWPELRGVVARFLDRIPQEPFKAP